MESKNGLMELFIWESGNRISQMESENSHILMETTTKVSGKKTKQTEREFIKEKMEDIMKGLGKMMNLMDLAPKNGEMVIFIKENLIKGRNRAKEFIVGQMDHSMMACGMKGRLKDMENIGTMMEEFMKGNGKRI